MYWTMNLKDVPANIAMSMATVVGDQIYSLDCFVSPSKFKKTKKIVYVLDTLTYRWSCLVIDLTSSKTPRYDDFSTVVHDQKIYTWGQDARDPAKNVLYCMDTARLTLTRPAQSGRVPRRRIGHEACVVGNEMFVLGGLEEASGDVQHGLMALDLYTLRWRKVNAKGEGPYLGATFGLVVLGFSIFVFTECACDDQSLSWDKVWRFDTDYEVWSCWTTEGNPPPITTDVALFAHGGYIYAFGGCWMGSDDFYRFCPDSRRWVYLKAVSGGTSASVLFGVSCLVVRNRVFVLGADDSASDARRSVRVLDFSPSLQTLCMRAVLQHVELPRAKHSLSSTTSKKSNQRYVNLQSTRSGITRKQTARGTQAELARKECPKNKTPIKHLQKKCIIT